MSETMKASDEWLKGIERRCRCGMGHDHMAADESRHARELNRILRGL